MQTPCYTEHTEMVFLHYEFGDEELNKVFVQTPCYTEHTEMVFLHYGFGDEELNDVFCANALLH